MKEILEPLKEYSRYQKQFDDSVDKTFEDLVKKSNIDVEKNRNTVKMYDEADVEYKKEKKKLHTLRGWRSFLIFLSIVGGVAAVIGGLMIYGAITTDSSILAGVLTAVIGPFVMIVSILIITLVLNKKIKALKEVVKVLKQNADLILEEAWKQMAPLNKLFNSDITNNMVNDLDTVIQIDRYYSVLHEVYLHKYYKFPYFSNDNSSTINMVVGTITGNPFVISRELEVEMGMKTYEGSLLVTWTETRRDSQGKTYTVTHSQTLIATVTKPCPFYDTETFLVYCNESAPDLNFSRKPQAHGKDDKQIDRMVKRGEKKLAKIAEDDMKHGDGSFVAMSDTEFDVLFGAFDRDNENQFRLLFTPLAQRNTIDLVKDSPYGDDFYFAKQGKLNTIYSHHGDTWDMLAGRNISSYSVDLAKQMFTNYNCNFFKNLYFMLAPLLSIPLYQQFKPNDMDIDLSSETNIAAREAEMLVNILPDNYIGAKGSATRVISKVKFISSIGEVDCIMIYAYSYSITTRTDFVPRVAGNGRMYSVPVNWDEYNPLMKTTEALIFDANGLSNETYAQLVDMLKRYDNIVGEEFSAIADCSGVVVVIPKKATKDELIQKINEILKKRDKDFVKSSREKFMNAVQNILTKQNNN